MNTMKQKRSNEFDGLVASKQINLGSQLKHYHHEEKLSENSKGMLFIDGPSKHEATAQSINRLKIQFTTSTQSPKKQLAK